MGVVIEGKFPQRPPRWPPNFSLSVNLRNVVNLVDSGEVVSLIAIYIQDGRPMYLHGANPELAHQMSKVLEQCCLQLIPAAVVKVEEAK